MRVCMFMLAPPYILYQETILSGSITDTLTAGEGNENLLVAERNWNVKLVVIFLILKSHVFIVYSAPKRAHEFLCKHTYYTYMHTQIPYKEQMLVS